MPVLFTVYINDLEQSFETANFTLYVDEPSIILSKNGETPLVENCSTLVDEMYNVIVNFT